MTIAYSALLFLFVAIQGCSGAKFPVFVDIALVTNCDQLDFNGEDIFDIVMAKFDQLVPDHQWIEPGSTYTGKNGVRTRRLLSLCPKCSRASNWKRCVKNKV